jgi:hypothetical protein
MGGGGGVQGYKTYLQKEKSTGYKLYLQKQKDAVYNLYLHTVRTEMKGYIDDKIGRTYCVQIATTV